MVTHGGGKELEEPVVVRPTSETVIGEYMAKWIQSYRDLPLLLNQWANVVRWELRPRLFLRSSEFLWQEGHTAHATEADARAFARRIHLEVYRSFMVDVLAMPVVIGDKTPQERFPGATNTITCEALMGDGKALQMGTSHELGQNFTRAFDITYLDDQGTQQLAWTTSWGVSTRMVGGLVMAHGDDAGLRLPPRLAPIQVVVLVVRDGDGTGEVAEAVVDDLRTRGVRVELDDRTSLSFGRRVTDWELKGVPLRIEVGPRDLAVGEVTVVQRIDRSKEQRGLDAVATATPGLLDDIQQRMLNDATAARRVPHGGRGHDRRGACRSRRGLCQDPLVHPRRRRRSVPGDLRDHRSVPPAAGWQPARQRRRPGPGRARRPVLLSDVHAARSRLRSARWFSAALVIVALVTCAAPAGATRGDPQPDPTSTETPTTTTPPTSTPEGGPGPTSTLPGGVTTTTVPRPKVTAGPGGFGAPAVDPNAPPEPPIPDPSPEVRVLLAQLSVQAQQQRVAVQQAKLGQVKLLEQRASGRVLRAQAAVGRAQAQVRTTQRLLRQDAVAAYISPGQTGFELLVDKHNDRGRTRTVLLHTTVVQHVEDKKAAIALVAERKRTMANRVEGLRAAQRATARQRRAVDATTTELGVRQNELGDARGLSPDWSLPIEGTSAFTAPELAAWFAQHGVASKARADVTRLAADYIAEGGARAHPRRHGVRAVGARDRVLHQRRHDPTQQLRRHRALRQLRHRLRVRHA